MTTIRDIIKQTQDASKYESKIHGGEEEERQRREFVDRAKREFDSLMSRLRDEAYRIGGNFRGPDIWREAWKKFRISS